MSLETVELSIQKFDLYFLSEYFHPRIELVLKSVIETFVQNFSLNNEFSTLKGHEEA